MYLKPNRRRTEKTLTVFAKDGTEEKRDLKDKRLL